MRFVRRNLVLRTMNKKDVEDYYFQFSELSENERKRKIVLLQQQLSSMKNDINSTVILVVKEKETNKLIGTIFGKRRGEIEDVLVSIPNESKLLKYGFEVIDQFLKICKEEWPTIKGIKLNRDNRAAVIYLKERNLESEYIKISTVA